MNYTLTLNLEGGEAVKSQLSKLLDSINKLGGGAGGGAKMPLNKWLSLGSEAEIEDKGKKIGESLGKGVVSAWGKHGRMPIHSWHNLWHVDVESPPPSLCHCPSMQGFETGQMRRRNGKTDDVRT